MALLEQGSLRVGHSRAPKNQAAQGGFEAIAEDAPASSAPAKPYISRLVLLVPAEIISLFVALKEPAKHFLPWFGLICIALVVLVRAKATSDGGRPEWKSVGVSVVSFILWMYSVGGSLPYLATPSDPGIIAVAIAIWTFAVPYFYTGQAASNPPAPAAGQ